MQVGSSVTNQLEVQDWKSRLMPASAVREFTETEAAADRVEQAKLEATLRSFMSQMRGDPALYENTKPVIADVYRAVDSAWASEEIKAEYADFQKWAANPNGTPEMSELAAELADEIMKAVANSMDARNDIRLVDGMVDQGGKS